MNFLKMFLIVLVFASCSKSENEDLNCSKCRILYDSTEPSQTINTCPEIKNLNFYSNKLRIEFCKDVEIQNFISLSNSESEPLDDFVFEFGGHIVQFDIASPDYEDLEENGFQAVFEVCEPFMIIPPNDE